MEKIFSTQELKDALGHTYVDKIRKHITDLSYFKVYRVLMGTSNNLEDIKKVIAASQKAMAENDEVQAFKNLLSPTNVD